MVWNGGFNVRYYLYFLTKTFSANFYEKGYWHWWHFCPRKYRNRLISIFHTQIIIIKSLFLFSITHMRKIKSIFNFLIFCLVELPLFITKLRKKQIQHLFSFILFKIKSCFKQCEWKIWSWSKRILKLLNYSLYKMFYLFTQLYFAIHRVGVAYAII